MARIDIEDHSVRDFLRSLTWKDLTFLFGLCSIVFGAGVAYNKQFGDLNASARSQIENLKGRISELQQKERSLGRQVTILSSDKSKATVLADQSSIQIGNYKQCLISIVRRLQNQINLEREAINLAAGTYNNKEIREQVLADWVKTLKPQTDHTIENLTESLEGDAGTCVYRMVP